MHFVIFINYFKTQLLIELRFKQVLNTNIVKELKIIKSLVRKQLFQYYSQKCNICALAMLNTFVILDNIISLIARLKT